jgi:hypothetical protein
MGLRWLFSIVPMIAVCYADHGESRARGLRLGNRNSAIRSPLPNPKVQLIPLRASAPILRLSGGGGVVATRKILDEYTHEIKSRHEGKSGALHVEVSPPDINVHARASNNGCLLIPGSFTP